MSTDSGLKALLYLCARFYIFLWYCIMGFEKMANILFRRAWYVDARNVQSLILGIW